MVMRRIWIWLSLTAAVLMAVASAAGIILPSHTRVKPRHGQRQGRGEDIANLFVVFPAMLIALGFRGRSE